MAATLSGTYTSTPDTPSPIYPDRLIRPLPKRPIRARLSQEAADSILFPPVPPATQLFYGAYGGNGEAVNDAKVYVQQNINNYGHDNSPELDQHHPYSGGVVGESEDEDGPGVIVRRSAGFRGSSVSPAASRAAHPSYPDHADDVQTKSASSGPDGYDAFENTNNKKKRKIPTSGNLGNHSSTLSADLANMGLSGVGVSNVIPLDDGSGGGGYHGPSSPVSPAGNGISGPGRGRFGRNAWRSGSGRTPLSTHAPNAWMGGRPGASRRSDHGLAPAQGSSGETGPGSDQGIISAAIANAAAMSSSEPTGQENVSLLDQQARKSSPRKTQFTFTCESDSSKGMVWPTKHPYPIPQHHRAINPSLVAGQGQRGFATQGTQTSPNMAAPVNQQGQAIAPQHPGQPAQATQAPGQGRKPRRSPGSIYALAARQRKIQQQYANLHHPPNLEDIWICEFCEYESIFGRPPEALIRQYEIKDRKERRRLAEKRRLLEKAKMKGRKGKKATKNAAKQAAAQQQSHQAYDRQATDQAGMGNPDVHGDEYLGDEYDDESISPVEQPPPQHAISVSDHPKTGTGTGTPGKVAGDVAGGGPGGGT